MKSELCSGRLVGYIFAIPCSVVALIGISQSAQHSGFWAPSALFGLGAAVGIYLLLNPRILVSVNGGMLELYPGRLGSNKRQIAVPLEDIEGFEVKAITDRDGTSWLLSLHVREPQSISEEAQSWINASVPKAIRDQANDRTILWSLAWPEGGVRGARTKMKELTSPSTVTA